MSYGCLNGVEGTILEIHFNPPYIMANLGFRVQDVRFRVRVIGKLLGLFF